MTGKTWSEFRLEAFGEPYLVWHDGPDFVAFEDAYRADPTGVGLLLREGLAQRDPLAAEAVGRLQLSPELTAEYVTLLRDALATAHGGFVTRAACALRDLTGDMSWGDELVRILLGTDHWGVRMDAARLLSDFSSTVERIAALMRGAQDEQYLVRYHSANTLLGWAGEPRHISDDTEYFPLLMAENSPKKWSLVAAGLAGAASARLAG